MSGERTVNRPALIMAGIAVVLVFSAVFFLHIQQRQLAAAHLALAETQNTLKQQTSGLAGEWKASLETRLAGLEAHVQEKAVNTSVTPERLGQALSLVKQEVSEHYQRQIASLEEKISLLERRNEALAGQYQALAQRLAEIRTSVPAVTAPANVSSVGKVETRSAAKTPSTLMPKPKTPMALPFIVNGIELRGGTAFVSIAPKGAHRLEQVRLLTPGEEVNGWTLLSIGHRQATFRAGARTQTLNIR